MRSPLIAASVTFALKADVSSDGLYYWVMFWPTYAVARMVGTRWPGCSGSRYLVALPDTRM